MPTDSTDSTDFKENPYTLFIVYHKELYKENIEGFSEELLNRLKWVAVNEEIEKTYPSYTEGRLLKEWEMKEFSPIWQMCHWHQNSFFHHLYKNPHLIQTKYIGFAQYDQKLCPQSFQDLFQVLKDDTADKVIGTFIKSFQDCCDVFVESEWVEVFLEPYNKFYFQNHSIYSLKTQPMFFLHTFFIPTWYFFHIMPFIEYITPLIIKKLGWGIRHVAGTLERVYAMCIACGILEGKFRHVTQFKGIQNCEKQRLEDTMREIETSK